MLEKRLNAKNSSPKVMKTQNECDRCKGLTEEHSVNEFPDIYIEGYPRNHKKWSYIKPFDSSEKLVNDI